MASDEEYVDRAAEEEITNEAVLLSQQQQILQEAAAEKDGNIYFEIFRFIFAVLIIAAAFFARAFLVNFILRAIFAVSSATDKDSQKRIEETLAPPLSFLSVTLAVFVSMFIIELPDEFEYLGRQIQLTFLNVIVFWVAYRAIDPVSRLVAQTSTGSFGEEARDLAVKVFQLLLGIVGFLSILQAWGVNVTAFLAGLGLLGMAIALAAQDTMKNFFGTIVIIADNVFHKGDWIKTPQVEGIVESFGLRTTVIRGFDDSQIHISNATLADTTIINFSRCRVRQISMTLPLGCPATAAQLRKIVQSYRNFLEHNPDVVQPNEGKPIVVNLDAFGENSVLFFIYFFTKNVPWVPYMEFKEKVLLEFKRLAEEAHISFGVPTRSVFLKNVD